MWALTCRKCKHFWYSEQKKKVSCPRCGSSQIRAIKAQVEFKHRCVNQHTWTSHSVPRFCPRCRSNQITTVKTVKTPGRSVILSQSEELMRSVSEKTKHSCSENLMTVFNKDRPISNCFLCDAPVDPSRSYCPVCGSSIMSVDEALKKFKS